MAVSGLEVETETVGLPRLRQFRFFFFENDRGYRNRSDQRTALILAVEAGEVEATRQAGPLEGFYIQILGIWGSSRVSGVPTLRRQPRGLLGVGEGCLRCLRGELPISSVSHVPL